MKTCFKIMMRMLKNYEKEIRNSWEKIRKLSGNIVDWEYAKHKIPRVNLRLAHSTREVRWDFTIRYTKNALLIFRKSLRRDLQLPKDVRNSPRRLEKQFLEICIFYCNNVSSSWILLLRPLIWSASLKIL